MLVLVNMILVVVKPNFADGAVAVAGAGLGLHDLGGRDFENLGIDSKLVHVFLLL